MAAKPDVLSHTDALILLLTAETLLLTAFTVMVLLVSPAPGGRKIPLKQIWRGAVAVGVVLSFVAVGAIFAWWQVFAEAWPGSGLSRIEAIAAFAGIAVQPAIALLFCVATKP